MKPKSSSPKDRTGHAGHLASPKVVVVGAGVSGVGAAGALMAGGIQDVVILEATDQPGGRVKSTVLDEGFVELGAQWIHGRNDIFHIAEREGMLAEQDSDDVEVPDSLLQFSSGFTFRTSDGNAVSPDTIVHNLKVLENLHGDSVEQSGTTESRNDVNLSVGDLYREDYSACRGAMMGTEPLKTAMFRWLEAWECQDTGGSVDQLSLPGSGQYVYCPGSGIVETTRGVAQVFHSLLTESVPSESIRLNKAVKRIHWAEETASSEKREPLDIASLDDEVDEWVAVEENTPRCINNNVTIKTQPLSLDNAEAHGTVTSEEENPSTEMSTNQTTEHLSQILPDPESELFHEGDPTTLIQSIPSRSSSIDPPAQYTDFERTGKAYPVRIECEDGDEFLADHVIVTASMGFLKEHPQLFHPLLPPGHRQAISSIGFGNAAKAFLFWDSEEGSSLLQCLPGCVCSPNSCWSKRMLGSDVEGVIPLWVGEARPQLSSAKYKKPMSNGHQWYEDVCMFTLVRTHGQCIAAWAGSEAAVVMETLPESEVKDVLHELLAFALDNPSLPPPSRFLRTQWYSNPYTRGAYSYLATGMPLKLHHLLQKPVPSLTCPAVQLAGEACSKHYYSTVHGALESGRQAADVILRHHNSL